MEICTEILINPENQFQKYMKKKRELSKTQLCWWNNPLKLCPVSGVNTGGVGSYIYDDPEAEAQP